METARTTIDQNEVDRFSAHGCRMVEPGGEIQAAAQVQSRAPHLYQGRGLQDFQSRHEAAKPFDGLRFLDIGCGGGLLSEPMARLGAEVVGADPSEFNIEVAKLHASQSGVTVDYRAVTAEALAEAGEKFDVILNMEVVEHVADVPLFIEKCGEMLKPGGLMFIATINRTFKAARWRCSWPRKCCAGCRAARTSMKNLLSRPNSKPHCKAQA